MKMFWLSDLSTSLKAQVRDNSIAHAVMLAGRPGIGKRRLAFDVAAYALGVPVSAQGNVLDEQAIQAPDFHWLAPAEGKRQISIDQVRALNEQMALSAHASRKTAIIDAANQMTTGAANALLKTLEEPPGEALLLLIADDITKIPATILSRCVRHRVPVPDRTVSLEWLVGQGFDAAAAEIALAQFSDAPLAAAKVLNDGTALMLADVWQDALAIAAGREAPLTVANRWRKLPFDAVLGALGALVRQLIYPKPLRMRSVSGFDDYVMDKRDAFCYLENLNAISRMTPGSFNAELALDSLLIPWQTRLKT